MKFNFKNRVRNFKFSSSDVFVPLHEAIMNSIQAIEERGNFNDSQIKIKIERDSYRIAGFTSGIFSIEITDNGIGFVSHNYESFCTSDSDYKVEIGGKGVGRINWLKAFEVAYISSVFEEDNKRYQRLFSFNIEEEIHDEKLTEVSNDTPIETKIILYNLNQEYRGATEISLKEIAGKIIEHFASYFVIGAMPKVILEDENEQIDVNELFVKEKFIETKNEIVTSNNVTFNLRHVFLNASINAKHKIYICAQNRVVCSYDLVNVDDLPTTFNINGKKAIYQCYVHGEFLDNDVNSERTYFSNVIFEEEDDNDRPHFELAINLYQVVYSQIHQFLQTYLEPMRDTRDNQINDYIENYCPQYKYLTKYAKEDLQSISYAVASNPEKLISELNKLNNKLNNKHNIQITKAIQDNDSDSAKNKLLDLTTQVVENLHSQFTNYLQKRNSTIEMLEKLINLKTTTDEIINKFFLVDEGLSSDNTNTWLIDERLAYHFENINSDKETNFYAYYNDHSNELICIDFERFDYAKYKKSQDLLPRLEEKANGLEMNNAFVTKYLIVFNLENINLELAHKNNIHILTYHELVQIAKQKYEDLLK